MVRRLGINDLPTSLDAKGTEQILVEAYRGDFIQDPNPQAMSFQITDSVLLGAVTLPVPEPERMPFSTPYLLQEDYGVFAHDFLVTVDFGREGEDMLEVHDLKRQAEHS
jgi:hypothetical protein